MTDSSFPVHWDSPEEAALTWTWDRIHCPKPFTPMTASVFPAIVSAAINEVMAASGAPVQQRMKIINGYAYGATAPKPGAARPAGPRRQVPQQAIADLPRRWREEFEPELVRDLERMRAIDLRAFATDALERHLDEALALHRRHWVIHMQTVMPVFAASGAFVPLYKEATSSRDEAEPYKLLQGFDNKTLECDRALRVLAESVRGDAAVRAALARDSVAHVQSALRAAPSGQAFLARLDAFLDRYGHRASAGDDYADVTWREDPSFVLNTICGILAKPPVDMAAHQERLAQERDALTVQALARVEADASKREALLTALRQAQAVWPLRETHAFFIDQASMAMLRRVLVEMGCRLAASGSIAGQEDVFYITLDEARDVFRTPRDLRPLVRQRRDQNEAWAALEPPPTLGAPPAPGVALRDPELSKFAGEWVARPAAKPRVLQGAGASAGIASGVARIVRTPMELARLRPGEILVCASTTPAWTPLFAVAAGIVTDYGGVLCHAAIVAREYRIPAVAGVGYGTSLIPDGALITIDGAAGTVTLG